MGPMLPEFTAERDRLREYRRFVLEELANLAPIDIACLVTANYVFDFLVLYESIVESWTFYPFQLHAFVSGREAHDTLAQLELPHVKVHLLPEEPSDWWGNTGQKIRLIEHSGLERAIVTDVDNVFAAETPELFMLLDEWDFVFVGSPGAAWPIQTNVWAFRRNERTIRFAIRWYEESQNRIYSDASGLPFALEDRPDDDLRVKVLARHRPGSNRHHYLSPYCVQASTRPFSLTRDPLGLGYREADMGRAKVIHLTGLHDHRGRATAPVSLMDRLRTVIDMFPESSQFFPLYATLAKRAAVRLGMEVVASPMKYLDRALSEAGVPRRRHELPELLNQRGLLGSGVEVGVSDGFFSEQLLQLWRGRHLLSVDPWMEAPIDEYFDHSNVGQARQDRRYAATQKRLSKYGERSTIWRMTSAEAAERILDHSLDFVYLDARHDYDSVKTDIELWHDKVRPGGILAGHDYIDGDLPYGRFGVQSAVNERFGTRVRTTALDVPGVSWFVEIPVGEAQE